MGVNVTGDGDAAVTHQLLRVFVLHAGFKEDRGEPVAELVRGDVVANGLAVFRAIAFIVARLGIDVPFSQLAIVDCETSNN